MIEPKLLRPKRVCKGEEYIVHHAADHVQYEWIFHYNDGSEESVKTGWSVKKCTNDTQR